MYVARRLATRFSFNFYENIVAWGVRLLYKEKWLYLYVYLEPIRNGRPHHRRLMRVLATSRNLQSLFKLLFEISKMKAHKFSLRDILKCLKEVNFVFGNMCLVICVTLCLQSSSFFLFFIYFHGIGFISTLEFCHFLIF